MDRNVNLPDKLFFKIGEVSRIVGAETHVLRYWEREFSNVRPRKSRGGQRLYRRADVEELLRIKLLLKEEGFTIAGARRKLAAERAARRAGTAAVESAPDDPAERAEALSAKLDEVRKERDELRRLNAATSLRLAEAQDALVELRHEISLLLRALERSGS